MANEIKKELIQKKLDLVIQKLMHLGAPENEDTLKEGGEAIGFFSRDFGIKEWDWPQGIGLYGLLKIAKMQDSEEYRTFLHDWFKENIAQGLPSRNINTTTPLLTLCELNEIYHDPEFEALCLDWAKWLMECIPRTREGGFQHVTSANGDRQGVRLNESEMWIDTLFMTVLFLNRMGQKYGKQEWIDESIKQVLMHIKYLYDTHTGLFFHGWSFNRMDNFGGVFWCRGNSWFTLGILDYLDMFKGALNQGVKAFILDTYKAQVRALRDLQGEDGLWHTVLDDPTSYEETSGSAAITAGILKGIRMGILDDSYLPCARKAIRAILKNIDTDGTVLKVSGGTGMGYDRSTLELLGRVAEEHDLLIAADEIYTTYLYEGDFIPIRTIPGLAHRVITLNSFSKNFLMTGWRVGVAIAEPELLDVMSNINNSLIYTAPSISQRAAIQALAIRQTIREKYVLAYRDRIFYAADRMEQIPYLSLVRPKGTFYLFPGIEKTGLSAEDFCQALLERAHVLVTPGTLFGSTGAGHFRIACTVGLDRLKEAFDRMEGLSF